MNRKNLAGNQARELVIISGPMVRCVKEGRLMESRIMYVEHKGGGLTGAAWIGRVSFSKTHRTVYYRGLVLRRLSSGGYKTNHYDVATGEDYWVSGPKHRGGDRLYGEPVLVHVDEDVRAEYWTAVRGLPHRAGDADASR